MNLARDPFCTTLYSATVVTMVNSIYCGVPLFGQWPSGYCSPVGKKRSQCIPYQGHCVEFLLSQCLTPHRCTGDCDGLLSCQGRIEILLKEMGNHSCLMSHLAYLQMVRLLKLLSSGLL